MIDRSNPLPMHEFPTKLIHFEYPTLGTMHDCCETPAEEIEILKTVRHRMYEEIAKLDNRIEELSA